MAERTIADVARTCLVIDSRKLSALALDGPALRVRMDKQNTRLFPLRRLSRIHIMGALHDGFDALLHCAEQQIPVAFFTIKGKLRCQLYYPVFEHSVLSHWLDHMEFDPEAKQQYEEWLAHQTLYMLSTLGERRGAYELRRDLVEERLNGICRQMLGEKRYRDAQEWISGMLMAHLSQIIVGFGLQNQGRNKRRLQQDITPLCALWLLHHFAGECRESRAVHIDGFGMSAFYQRYAETLEYLVRRMLVQLSSRLESII